MKVSVIGDGAWGTALANLLCHNQHAVTLWAHDIAQVEKMRATRRNDLFLPGIPLDPLMDFEPDLDRALAGCEYAVIAVPSKFLRAVTGRAPNYSGIAISVTKGIEFDSGLTMSGVLKTTMPKATVAVLSGPTLALEVARNIPAAIVAAHPDSGIASAIQLLFNQPTFRVYTCNDVIGVELGGALKNILAIAAGMADGLGFGDNSKAAMITRALAEMRRLGTACGARAETFGGLSGLGDLTVTCFSHLSRNRAFGERIGRGEKVEAIIDSMVNVAEGYPTTRSAYQLARRLDIETPIIDEVYATLYGGKDIQQAVRDLMSRAIKQED
jgi:glycerol-3-phosphate dehydrogenase (NAD(P)+)